MTITPETSARQVLEVIPRVMRQIRTEMRSCRMPDLTVPQLRALAFINSNAGASLSDVSEHLGLALPSTSKLMMDW